RWLRHRTAALPRSGAGHQQKDGTTSKLGLLGLAAAVAVGAGLTAGATPAAAHGGPVQCNNQTRTGMTVTGNIEVPNGAFCDLSAAHVTGNAMVDPNAGLSLDNASSIGG